MLLIVMIELQVAGQVAGPPVPADLRPVKPLAVAQPCNEPDDNGDIVVCGRAAGADRLPKVDPDRYNAQPIRATTHIGKVGVSAEAEQGALPNGQSSPRAMVRFKLPF